MSNSWRHPQAEFRRSGFTIIELLVAIAIIAILVSLLAPGMASVRSRSREFECAMHLRSVAFEFRLFADPQLHSSRGEDKGPGSALPRGQFRVETFQESMYRIDEFWDWPDRRYTGEVDDLGVMRCPEVSGPITLRAQASCRDGAIGPKSSVSYGFNLRLDSQEAQLNGMWIVTNRRLTDRLLSAPGAIPLAFDIDGVEAERRDVTPHYAAPPLDPDAPYGSGQYWFPSSRHRGRTQVAFVGGEVVSDSAIDPASQPSWRWDY
ncbi:MAG: type II secretion system protein [Phycisphaerales bacterium]